MARLFRYSALFGFVLSALASPIAPPAGTDDFNELLIKGEAAFAAWDIPAAKHYFRQACTPILDPAVDGSGKTVAIALCEHSIGSVSEAEGNPPEAVAHYVKAGDAWQRAGNLYPVAETSTLMNLAGMYRLLNRGSEAEAVLQRALKVASQLPEKPELTAAVEGRLGDFYNWSGQPEKARAVLEKAVAALAKLSEENAPEHAFALNALGSAQLRLGYWQEGEARLREAVELATASLGEGHPETATYEINLAQSLYARGQHPRAYALLRKAKASLDARLVPGARQLGTVYSDMAAVETAMGKLGMAEESARKAITILQGSEYGSDFAVAQLNLGVALLRQNRLAEAAAVLPRAIEAERALIHDPRVLAEGVRRLAELRTQEKKWNEAGTLYREVIALYTAGDRDAHPNLAGALNEYAAALKHQGGSPGSRGACQQP